MYIPDANTEQISIIQIIGNQDKSYNSETYKVHAFSEET